MIRKHFDPLFETLGYCNLAVNNENSTSKETQDTETEAKRQRSIQLFQENMPETMKVYFRTFANVQSNLANCLLLSFYDCNADDFTQAKENILNRFHQYSLSSFPAFSITERGFNFENVHEQCPFTDSLSISELNDEERYQVLSAFMNFDNVVTQLIDFLDHMSFYLPSFDLNSFYEYWSQPETQKDLRDYLAMVGVQIDNDFDQLEIIPVSYAPFIFSFSMNDTDTKGLIIIGFTQDIKTMIEVFSEKKSSQNEKILKLLSDPSKYAILKMIKTKAYYGAEIAKAMNLKTSTISYHLNACVDAQLVHVHKVENKIYFELNHETFNQFIQTLKSDFE